MNDLAIIIVNWNTRDLTVECCRAVREHLRGIAYEIIVVDNGSTDGSVEALRAADPALKLVEHGENLGFARAVNRGVQVTAPSKHLLLLNSDARVTPGSIEKLVKHLDEHPEAGAVGPQLLNPDGTPQHSYAPFPSLAGELLNKSLLRLISPRKFPGRQATFAEPTRVDSLIGAALCIRRSAWEQVGPLDVDYFVFLEETDWCWRARRSGQKIVLLPDATVIHAQGQSRGNAPVRARIEYWRSMYTFFAKRRRGWRHILFRLLRPLRLFGSWTLTLLALLLTLGLSGRLRRRFSEYSGLVAWHLRGCPVSMGLSSGKRIKMLANGPVA